MPYARIQAGEVFEPITLPDGVKPSDRYSAAVAATIVPCPAGVAQGWSYDGTNFAPPAAAPPVDLRAYAAAARYTRETGGVTVGTAPIATDRASQALITGAYVLAQAQPNAPINFKTPAGFVQLTAAQMTSIALAVGAHVQACFAAEGQIDAAITAGTIATPAQIDAAFAAVTA